jgi:hypothetical protein
MKDNLFIFFAPGLGGHHLANILSLTGKYEYTVNYSKYFLEYSAKSTDHAHFQSNNHKKSIYLYHFGSADDSKVQELINQPNTQFLVIHLPQNNKIARWRLEVWNKFDSKGCHLATKDIEKIYKPQILEKLYPGKWNTVMADELFSDTDPDQFLKQLENNLNVEILDKELAKRIHSQWISTLKNAYQQQNS